MSLAPRTTAPGTLLHPPRGGVPGRATGGGPARARSSIGGDYVGLGIARRLGRRGVPVVVVDDERTITRFSRYTSHAVQVQDLRDEATRDTLLAAGERLGLDGWVLYPTRDEIVAAISKHRDALGATYRVPVPEWGTVRWASDKRNTYELAAREGVPAPRTWLPALDRPSRGHRREPPFAVKPAIKEHFIYATGAKAWRADTRGGARTTLCPGVRGHGWRRRGHPQELIRGAETTSSRSARSSATASRRGAWSPGASASIPPSSAARRRRRDRRHPDAAGAVRAAAPRDRLRRPRRARVQADRRDWEYKLLDFNARALGLPHARPEAGVDFPAAAVRGPTGPACAHQRARPGVRWIRRTTDLPTSAVELWAAGWDAGGARMFGATRMWRPSSAARTLIPGSPRSRSSRT